MSEALTPPHSTDAEKAVVGAILRDGSLFNIVVDRCRLRSEFFFHDAHRAIFKSIEDFDSAGEPITIVGVSDKVPGISTTYLVDLTESTPFSEDIEYYARMIREKFFLRKIVSACQTVGQKAMRVDGDVPDFLSEIEREFLAISGEQDTNDGLISAKEVLLPTLKILENRIASDGVVTGISSGFHDLDHFTGGWQSSDLIILAARPGMGKTALALNCALNGVKKGSKIALFTLEMSKEQLTERLLSAEGRIDSTSLRKGDLDEDSQYRLMEAAQRLSKFGDGLAIDETAGITLSELRSRCRRYKKEHGLDMIIIDYLQLMSGSPTARKQGREREISEISMGLKNLAKELHIPVIAMAQLNRGPDARPDKRPKLSDLRESGSMEQDADQILFIYRDDYYNPQSEDAGKAEVILLKNRHGETGTIKLAWIPHFISFHNLADNG